MTKKLVVTKPAEIKEVNKEMKELSKNNKEKKGEYEMVKRLNGGEENILATAKMRLKEFYKMDTAKKQVQKYSDLLMRDSFNEFYDQYSEEEKLEYLQGAYRKEQVVEEIIIKVINEIKTKKEIKDFIVRVMKEKIKLFLLEYYIIFDTYKGFDGLEILTDNINVNDLLIGKYNEVLNWLAPKGCYLNQGVSREETKVVLTEMVKKLDRYVKDFGIYDLIQQGYLDVNSYIDLTLANLGLNTNTKFANETVWSAIGELEELDVRVLEIECMLLPNNNEVILTTMDEQEIKETIWLDKFEVS
ncbi:MAG: hypothetical protein N4A64_10820 [Marinisporobacter sp.]|nr:hypothetical protein [Marinisporobacter sp.]